MERYELNKQLEDVKNRINSLQNSLNLVGLKKEHEILLLEQNKEDFWLNVQNAQQKIETANKINNKITSLESLQQNYTSIVELLEITKDFSEDYNLIIDEFKVLEKELNKFEIEVLLNEKYDFNNCIIELQAGAGGTESMDWCMMLFRMYLRYVVRKKFKYEVLDYQPGEEAGLKSAAIQIKGKYAYGLLKNEIGVHRLVRISPFDANKKRHTSFASLMVIPEIKDVANVLINDEELKIDVFRSSGAGGQSVNTTDSAVRITHLPTGIVITCQNERSQIKNRETALNILKSRLVQLKELQFEQEIDSLKGTQKEIAWGSQIRSYVFQPYQMVKDHRTNVETSQVDEVMDGDLDLFINAYLRQVKK